ncbi:leaderpeptidase and N-methyltransferase [Alcanivorax hongdengensis A-11-3]|uniref:Prepilin leader peptidase/N-methyltransferase n=2 Tax=Alcanivorax hongdengensis TaxID=519051 RepID=L0WEL3_9GAMM|nr:leaderpeptidase and N-methyltransferase [Alcanivorax hongdengensis A-11-3]
MMERAWKQEARELLELESTEALTVFNLVVPRSRCPHCDHQIRSWENIPVVSWLALRGKCSHCKNPISKRYPTVEIISGILSGLCAWHFGYGPWLAFTLFATWILLAAALIDFDTSLLPDSLNYLLLWAGLLAAVIGISPVGLQDAVIGAMAGYLSLWSIYWLFKLLTGKEGMGYGDFKLLAALGAWVGWQYLPLIILLSSVVGLVFAIIMMVSGSVKRDQGIPFGPYLATAGWIALLWGETIVSSYLGLFKLS